MLNDWTKIVYLYSIVHEFTEEYNASTMFLNTSINHFLNFDILSPDKYNLQNLITIKSYSYTSLLIGYGPKKEITVNIFWCTLAKEFKMIFTGGNSAINSHAMMREQLQSHLNSKYSLVQLIHILHETYQPLSSIAKLAIIPHLGIPVSYSVYLQLVYSIICL